MSRAIALILAALAFASSARALTEAEVVKLTKAGVSDTLILEMMKTDGSRFALDAAAVERLKGEGVSEPVLQRMWQLSQSPAPSAESPSPAAAARPERAFSPLDRDSRRGQGAAAARAIVPEAREWRPGQKARLTLRSEDDRVKAYAWDPARREVRFYPESRKDATDLARGASVPLDVDPGVIGVRWSNEYQHYRVTLFRGEPTELVAAPGAANGSSAIRLVVQRGGRFFAATNLKVFYDRPMPVVRVVEVPVPVGAYYPAYPGPAAVIVQPPACEPATSVHFGIGLGFHD